MLAVGVLVAKLAFGDLVFLLTEVVVEARMILVVFALMAPP